MKHKYVGLQPRQLSKRKTIRENQSESSDNYYDSGSEYLSPSQFNSKYMNSEDNSEELSLKSDIIIDYDDKLQPASSIVTNEQQNILDPKVTELSKIKRQGYNFNATVEKSKKNPLNNKRVWNKTDCCIFCEKKVTNFTRHITRNHETEIEVARYLSLKKGSKERQILADQLRKRENFLCNVGAEEIIKPVRRPNKFSTTQSCAANYLPCKYCFGLYKKNYLHRHEKNCKSMKVVPKRRNKAQAGAQNLLMAFIESDDQLVREVFRKMAVDNITIVVKTDVLIKLYGLRYFKNHREKHLVNIVSQKMRTLARLLIYMRNEDSNIKTLQDCLTPE